MYQYTLFIKHLALAPRMVPSTVCTPIVTDFENSTILYKKKITSRTTGAKGNKFLRVITSFNDRKIESNRYQVTNRN